MEQALITIDVGTFLILLLAIVNILVVGPTAWILKMAVSDLRKLEKSHDDLEKALPLMYVHKDDYHRDIQDIKEMLGRIFEKLDGKADKP